MRHRGFSLIEILLVVSLIAGLGLASFMCLSNGLKLWQRSLDIIADEDCLIFFDRLTQDLRNAFQTSQLQFQANENSISFPTLLLMDFDPRSVHASKQDGWQIGTVSYTFDIENKAIIRKQANYGQSLKNEWGGEQKVLSHVQKMSIQYFYQQQKQSVSFLKEGEIPQFIEIKVTIIKQKQKKGLKGTSVLVEDIGMGQEWSRKIMIPSQI